MDEGAREGDAEGCCRGEMKPNTRRRIWRVRQGTGDGWKEGGMDKREDVGAYVRRETEGRSKTGDGRECHRGETAEGRAWEK